MVPLLTDSKLTYTTCLVALVEIVTVFWDEERPTEKLQNHVVLPG
jgi:hypothetical protein